MAFVYITEYARQAKDNRGQPIAAGEEPALVNQRVAVGAETDSNSLDAKTRFVRVHTDAICSIKFGAAPTATTSDARLAANQTEYFGVVEEDVAKGLKISVISNT